MKRGERAWVTRRVSRVKGREFGEQWETHFDGVNGRDGYASDGHGGEDVARDLEQAHDERAVQHEFGRFPQSELAPSSRSCAVGMGGEGGAFGGSGVEELLADGEGEEGVGGDEGELDKGERDGVAELGEDGFARVGAQGGGEIPQGAEGDEADRIGGGERREGGKARSGGTAGTGEEVVLSGGVERGEEGGERGVVVVVGMGAGMLLSVTLPQTWCFLLHPVAHRGRGCAVHHSTTALDPIPSRKKQTSLPTFSLRPHPRLFLLVMYAPVR